MDSVRGMELRVGSNRIYFIYCCFSYGTCTFFLSGVCILDIVNCHNYMYYVCET